MSKPVKNDYDQYSDLDLLLRYAKLQEDDENLFFLPPFLEPNFQRTEEFSKKSLAQAIKIDKVVIECFRRGLMGPICDKEETERIAAKALRTLKDDNVKFELGEISPFGEGLTSKAIELKPWEHPSLQGKLHVFTPYERCYEKYKQSFVEVGFSPSDFEAVEEINKQLVPFVKEINMAKNEIGDLGKSDSQARANFYAAPPLKWEPKAVKELFQPKTSCSLDGYSVKMDEDQPSVDAPREDKREIKKTKRSTIFAIYCLLMLAVTLTWGWQVAAAIGYLTVAYKLIIFMKDENQD